MKWNTKQIDEITKVLRGKRLTTKELSDEFVFPVYHGGLIPLGYFSKFNRKANTVMIINVGASAGTVGFSNVDFWSSDGCFCIDKSEFDNKFLYYYLKNNECYFQQKVRKAGIPALDSLAVEKFKVPVIEIEEQQRIVSILDRFDTLCNDITQGLPAEIEYRTKQYEYYRDKLLTFKRIN